MSAMGQNEKVSRRAFLDRCTPESGRSLNAANGSFVPTTEVAAYSITSSARASSIGGTVRPSALAVFKLIISSYLVGA